jgi:amidophosphoribosyltransferase
MNPCVYGIDFPDRSKLMAANNTVDEIRKYLNADSLHYLSQAGMVKATGLPKEGFCMACYDGNYPVPYDPLLDKHIIERRRQCFAGHDGMVQPPVSLMWDVLLARTFGAR